MGLESNNHHRSPPPRTHGGDGLKGVSGLVLETHQRDPRKSEPACVGTVWSESPVRHHHRFDYIEQRTGVEEQQPWVVAQRRGPGGVKAGEKGGGIVSAATMRSRGGVGA